MEKLIDKSIAGDEKSYAELIKLVQYDLYRVANSKLHNKQDVEDAIQETILKAYQNIPKLTKKVSFKSWILKILINECNNIIIKRKKDKSIFDKYTGVSENTDIYNISEIDSSLFVDELLDKLNDDEKEIANLYFKDNLTTEAIAKILHSNKNTVKSKLYRIRFKLKKFVIFILILCIVGTTTVFAKDIIKFITSLFTTSREAIDTAVENDYVQNVDMDFIYDNGIGIKVDYILIDNKNLSVSYVFDCKGNEDVTDIKILNHTIKDESGNVLFADSFNYNRIYNSSANYGTSTKIDNSTFRNSAIYTANNYFPISKKLYFSIDMLSINKNNVIEDISGNWTFEILINEKFFNRENETYLATYSPYIENIDAKISETNLKIDMVINTNFNDAEIIKDNSIILKNEFYNFECTSYDFQNNKVNLTFDISKYTENNNKLHLYIKLNENEAIDIDLIKSNT